MTSLKPLDRWGQQPADFNRPAAEVVFKALMAMEDDEALVFGRMLVHGAVVSDLIEHRGEINKALREQFVERAELMKASMARTAVSKARAGQDNTPELAALVEIAKAMDAEDRRDQVRQEHRDASGRFAEGHVKIGYDDNLKPLPDAHAKQFGIPALSDLKDRDKARFQQAYQQIHDLVAPYKGMGDQAVLHVTSEDKDGTPSTRYVTMPGKGRPLPISVKPGEKITSAAVSVQTSPSFGGATFDTLSALGAPRAGATAAGMTDNGLLDPDRLKSYNDEMSRGLGQEDYTPSRRVFHRIEHGSKLLSDSFGDAAPRKVQYALAVSEHVGRYGPEAQRVIGPTADKTAYRYRGTEKPVDPKLANGLESVRRNPTLQTGDAKRDYLLHGTTTDAGWNPSGVLAYFRSQLPKSELNSLQVKSGKVPPSQGIILDRNGKAVHQSVGFGDDWYLPFNLKNLKALKGGEYIRTRTFGGPTTEDMYTGLVGGARAMTVVSNNGTYTVDFDDNLRGGRRFNDKAAAMVGRYGQLLDAVKSGQVETGGIDPSRLAELSADAATRFDPYEDQDRYKGEYQRLVAMEKTAPRLSQAMKDQAAVDYLSSLADKETDEGGQVQSVPGMVANYVNRAASRDYADDVRQQREMRAAAKAQGLSVPAGPIAARRSLDDYRAARAQDLMDPDPAVATRKIVQAMGKSSQLDAHLKRTQDDYARALKPLQLDGAGYATALDALQEQFPYYIKGVSFHPWDGGSNARDTGYVRPNHNRPAEALAGYFDRHSSRNGEGKVFADTTRFQNGRLSPVLVNRPAREPEAPKAEEPARAATAQAPVAPTADTQRLADQAMLSHLLSQTHISKDAYLPTSAQGAEVRALIPHMQDSLPDLYGILSTKPADYETVANDPGLHDRLVAALKPIQAQAMFDLDPNIVSAFERGGAPVPVRDLPSDPAAVLGTANAEYNLDELGTAYRRGSAATASQIRGTYRSDPRISAMVDADALPDDLSDPDFPQMARDLEVKAKAQREANAAKLARGDAVLPVERQAAVMPAEALVRAHTLRRRYTEAVGRDAQVSAPAGTALDTGEPPIKFAAVNADDPNVNSFLAQHGLNPLVP